MSDIGTVYAERDAYRDVLTDLIDHLRAWERLQRTGTGPVDNPDYLAWMADRAEARLREVTGDE